MSKKQEISDKAQGSYKVQETKYIILNSAGLQSGEKIREGNNAKERESIIDSRSFCRYIYYF